MESILNTIHLGDCQDLLPYILEKLDRKEILYIEKYDSYKNGYNATKGGDGRVINKKYDEKDIIKLYKDGKSTTEIGKKYNVCGTTITRILKKNKVKTRDNGNKYQQFDPNEFKRQWMGNYSLLEMSKYFNCDKRTLKRYAMRIGLPEKNKNIFKDAKGKFQRIATKYI